MSLFIVLKDSDSNEIAFISTYKPMVNAVNNLKKQNKKYVFDVVECEGSKKPKVKKQTKPRLEKTKDELINQLTLIIKKSDTKGMTMRSIRNYSRSFKKLTLNEQKKIINEMKEKNIIKQIRKQNSIGFCCV